MEMIITNYRLGGKRSYPSQIILQPKDTGVKLDELIGKKVEYKDKYGNVYKGVIIKKHGRKGLLARFEPHLPGYALGDRAFLKG